MVLPAPLGPTMAVSVPGAKRARHVVDRHVAAEADREVAGFEHGVASPRPLPAEAVVLRLEPPPEGAQASGLRAR